MTAMANIIDERTMAEFAAYRLQAVIKTDIELGRGSYAAVLELHYRGLKCAGKKLYAFLHEQGIGHAARRYLEECHLLSQTKHPNIVQFLGVFFEEGSQFPILVMEYLPTNLTSCLERYGVLPDEVSFSILHGVSLGIAYLHGLTPVIIHRDLSANNVLLSDSMSAKISDLGVARILNLTPLQQMTETPGTQAYMPPEVMVANPQYGVSVDEFSFGALMVHVFTAEWPAPKVGPNRVDPSNPQQLIPVFEAERREDFLRKIGQDHPLMDLIMKCLSNNPQLRPHATDIVERMSDMVLRFPASFGNRVEMLRRINADEAVKGQLQHKVDTKAAEIEEKERDKASILQEKERLQKEQEIEIERTTLAHSTEVEQLQMQVDDQRATIRLREDEITTKRTALFSATKELGSKNLELEASRAALEKKDAIIEGLNGQLTRTRTYLTSKQQPLQATLSFSQCEDAPVKMTIGQSIVIGSDIYYGGGVSSDSKDLVNIYCYRSSQDKWTTLPPHPNAYFGLGQINGELVTVGGGKVTVNGDMYKYNEQWVKMDPTMPTARLVPTVLSHPSCLIAAGGHTSRTDVTDIVEIYNINASQWSQADKLPFANSNMSGAVHNDTVYMIGGWDGKYRLNKTLVASIDTLISKAGPETYTTEGQGDNSRTYTSAWKEMTNTPIYRPSIAVVSGMILAVGGSSSKEMSDKQTVKDVYAYSTSMNSWLHIGDLPTPLVGMSIAMVSPTEFVVIGGRGNDNEYCNTVYKGTLSVTIA